MSVNQLPFEWHQRRHEVPTVEIGLAPPTIETVIALMATALIVVVRGAAHVEEEAADDER
jgi:hypothetical protein